MADEIPEDLVLELNRFPQEQEDELVVGVELIKRRLAMTVAERVHTHWKARELIERLTKRLRDKYAVQVWFH